MKTIVDERAMRVVITLASALCIALPCACLRDPPPEVVRLDAAREDARRDAREPTRIERLELADADGTARHPWELARRPTIGLRTSRALGNDEESVVLLAGPPDAELEEDLETAPLRQETVMRAVACTREHEGGILRLVPDSVLVPGGRYTLAVAEWALDEEGQRLELDGRPFVAAFTVRDDARAGAAAVDSWPPDGAEGVPPALPFVVVRFDGEVRDAPDGIVLHAEDAATPVPAATREITCEEVGWRSGQCVSLVLGGPLATGTAYVVDVVEAVHDASGAPLVPWRARFGTAEAGASTRLGWLAGACALDETAIPQGCVLADDRSVTLTARFDGPARVFLATAGAADAVVAPRGEASLRLGGIAPASTLRAFLRAVGLDGSEIALGLELQTTPSLAPLTITEVRANPRGAEPRQEYVEVWNWGSEPFDLAGLSLADAPDSAGDTVTAHIIVPAGARGLLVADAFDPEDAMDDVVPPGVPIARVGPSLGSGGIANSGEMLYLRDGEGRRISTAPKGAVDAGQCLVRVSSDPRDGRPGTFGVDALGCTPGRADRVSSPP